MPVPIHAVIPVTMLLILFSCSSNVHLGEEYRKLIASPEHRAKSAAANGHLIFEETFESRVPFASAHLIEVGPWPYALQYVNQPVFEGRKAVRFEIRKDQPLVKNGKRAEVCIVKGADGTISKETWYSFMVYCPEKGYEYDTDREIISQWYQDGTPAMTIRTHKDGFLLESGNSVDNRKQYGMGTIVKNKWTEFVLHVIHSYGDDGLVEIWRDKNRILSVSGGNMYNGMLPKWKLGLYKAGFKTNRSLHSRRIIYFDNIRVGDEHCSLADMTSL